MKIWHKALRLCRKSSSWLSEVFLSFYTRGGIDLNHEKNILEVDTVALDDIQKALVILDQTVLPNRIVQLSLKTQPEIWRAIHTLQVRGAPAIGVAAAIGLYLAAQEIAADKSILTSSRQKDKFLQKLGQAKAYLASARPTAVNLFWALDRMMNKAEQILLEQDIKGIYKEGISLNKVCEVLRAEALLIRKEDIDVCRQIGEHGLSLLTKGQGILTHCNAGQLATVKYGTATAPIYLGQAQGFAFKVFVDETRPLLQGARLTSIELQAAGVDVTLICDNMVAAVMQKGWVQAVLVGCDRVAANGDTANKIGTAGVALIAKHYGVPFYVCAPLSTIDWQMATGADMCIEERAATEVTDQWYAEAMAPRGIKVFNPAFDVTEHSLITAIITEKGIVKAPFNQSLQEMRVL
jgi:methylthioribose-1-phosphate isomerase